MTKARSYTDLFDLPPAHAVPPPMRARRVAVALAISIVAMFVVALVAPWQQSVSGIGRVIAYAPLERQQTIEAPIDGRIARFLVREGSRVQAGDVLLEISDNDAELNARLEAELALTEARIASYEARTGSLSDRHEAVTLAQRSAIGAAEARVRVSGDREAAAEQAVASAEADLDAAALNLARHRALVEQGLVSERELELAILAEARGRTALESARNSRDAARGEVEVAEAALEQARASMTAEVGNALASVHSAETDRQAAQAALLRLQNRVARQATQVVKAPRAGTVLRLLAAQGTEQVRAGDPLLVLVPDTTERAVELWLDGNDVALVSAGRRVRLQLEGWPAVQFAGWPSVAVGTFGGRVALVDSADDGRGSFRVLVLPDPHDAPWPDVRYLRQGVRANGWILLDQVRLGFELWRRLNGFPPAVRMPPTSTPQAPTSAGRYGGSTGYGAGGSGSDDASDYGASP